MSHPCPHCGAPITVAIGAVDPHARFLAAQARKTVPGGERPLPLRPRTLAERVRGIVPAARRAGPREDLQRRMRAAVPVGAAHAQVARQIAVSARHSVKATTLWLMYHFANRGTVCRRNIGHPGAKKPRWVWWRDA